MFKRTGWGFTITAVIVAGAIWALSNSDQTDQNDGFHFYYGIDLSGGTELIYELDLSEIEYDVGTSKIADVVKDMIAARLDAYGLKEIAISTLGPDRLVIQLPGAKDSRSVQDIKDQIEQTGRLEFLLVAGEERQGPARRLSDAVDAYNKALLEYIAARKADPNTPVTRPPRKPVELRQLEDKHLK